MGGLKVIPQGSGCKKDESLTPGLALGALVDSCEVRILRAKLHDTPKPFAVEAGTALTRGYEDRIRAGLRQLITKRLKDEQVNCSAFKFS